MGMNGIVHITPAIWIRDADRSPVCLSDADDLAEWLGRKCAALMRGTDSEPQLLELERLLARVEAAIDSDSPSLPSDLRQDVVAAIANLTGVSVTTAMAAGLRPAEGGTPDPAEPPADHPLRTPPRPPVEMRRL